MKIIVLHIQTNAVVQCCLYVLHSSSKCNMDAKFILDGVDNGFRDLDIDNIVLIYREMTLKFISMGRCIRKMWGLKSYIYNVDQPKEKGTRGYADLII